jgi:hypothetical protein
MGSPDPATIAVGRYLEWDRPPSSSLVAREQMDRRTPSRLILEVDVGEGVPLASRTMKNCRSSLGSGS